MKVQGVTGGMPVAGYSESSYRQSEVSADLAVPAYGVIDGQGEGNSQDKSMPDQVDDAIRQLNKTMETYSTELRFSLHQKSGEYYVKVINPADNTVVREIPPERVLDMVAHFKEMLGFAVDKFI
ncbi:flagellar protein YvyC [Desulfocucumis palustris]|uniref:Flagellar protein YvyC n=1 Tax=Desulfocucumis palustris TaxID=1898651 RepID=A0A2L2XAT4_9FIRM|nr:flagellar protein FlaG [Desulfocucumis palustris]GBF33182.1 flagellar protein YvyC [Desulfocucumis palustris]